MTTRFPCLNIVGGLYGADLIDQIAEGVAAGQKPADFKISPRTYLTDEIAAAWTDARSLWTTFQHRLERLSPEDIATSTTRDQWMIPLLSLLGYELLYISKAAEVDGQTYAISHRAGPDENAPPVHIVGSRQSLDRRPESGRPRLAPHSLLQEFINRTEHLWGIVTNGNTLRVLRDSQLIRRQAYLEFDLKQMMESEKFSDFALLFRLVHRTRFPHGIEDATECLLEKYYKITIEQGGRVRDRLRDGVEETLRIFANGFLHHPKNQNLRERVRDAGLAPHSFYQQLLRLIYRFLFLMVGEERNLVTENPIYRDHYSISRLRQLAELRSSYSEHEDLWMGLRTTFRLFEDEKFGNMLAVPPLNGDLFNTLQTADLSDVMLSNRNLLTGLWHLSMYRESEKTPWRRINYGALDVEELGSVYESLLDFQPVFIEKDGKPTFDLVYGKERKSTGSYYTPPELVNELIKSALVPVLEERLDEAKRMAIGEWRMVKDSYRKEFIQYASQRLQRVGSVAAGPGNRKGSISSDQDITEGGTLRNDLPDSQSSDFSSGQHSRGVGQTLPSGVHSIFTKGERQPNGIGDTSDPECGRWPLHREGYSATPKRDSYTGQTTTRFGTETETKKGEWRIVNTENRRGKEEWERGEIESLWRSTPFAIRYSLLAEKSLLSLKVCDPASGSGHFLLAAARMLGRELAKIRTGDDEPAPEHMRLAIRDAITHCIYAVDKNPLAVDLCKVALWMEGHAKGKPLTFLDHRIRCGDSLMGVLDLKVLEQGVPDEAFEPVTGDDKQVARSLKRQNRSEREGQRSLPFEAKKEVTSLLDAYQPLRELSDDTPEQIRSKVEAYQKIQSHGSKWWQDNTACHLWTSAFFTGLTQENNKNHRIPTTETLSRYLENNTAHGQQIGNAWATAQKHRFFHWPLEFPEVFAQGGFDVVLGNPPYDVIRENRYFRGSSMRGTGNLFAHFISRVIDILGQGGTMGFVIPLTLACGESFEAVRCKLYQNFGMLRASHYSIRPARLFPDVEQRITLLRALKRGEHPCQVFSTRLHRWHPGEERKVVAGAQFGSVGVLSKGIIPKVAGNIGASIYAKIASQPYQLKDWLAMETNNGVVVYYHAIARYWIKAYDFLPFFQRQGEQPGISTTLKAVALRDKRTALRFLCLLNSSLFYYWWLTQSDEFHVLESEVFEFGVPDDEGPWFLDDDLQQIVKRVMESYRTNAIRRQRRFGGHPVAYDEFRPRQSLQEIYAIDDMIAPLYGLSAEENQFLKTYDLEFRTDEE